MTPADLLTPMRKRSSALMSQVVHVYLSVKHSHWIAVMQRTRKEAKFKSVHTEALNEHWDYAVETVENLADYIENCLWEENTGENRQRAHRLCIIDRAEQAANAALHAARQQGRIGFARFNTMTFAYTKSLKFHINAMFAYERHDSELENAWLEAVQLIESDRFLEKGDKFLGQNCRFEQFKLITGDIDYAVTDSVYTPPEFGRPFLMADRYSKQAWAYGVLSQIYKHIHHTGATADALEYDRDYQEDGLGQNKYEAKQEWATTAASMYFRAGDLLSSADIYEAERVRGLYYRAVHCKLLAAEACVAHIHAATATDPSVYYTLMESAGNLMNVANAVQNWFEAGLEAIQSLVLSAEESEQKTLALRAELEGIVREVFASSLYTNPQNDATAWATQFLSQLTARTEAVQMAGLAIDAEVERISHYQEQARRVDPALSPAHEKMRHCWQTAAAVLDPDTRKVIDAAPAIGHRRKRKVRVASPLSLWLAINYAHLADGLYADAAAYYLRAYQAAAAGDTEQERCWRTAAETLLAAAGANLAILAGVSNDVRPDDLFSPLPSFDKQEIRAARWVRCGAIIAQITAAGCTGADGATLRRALVSLTELLEWVDTTTAALSEFQLLIGQKGEALGKITTATERLFVSIAKASSALRTSGLSPERAHAFAKLTAMCAELAEKCRSHWEDANRNNAVHIGRCAESGLGSAAEAFGAGSEAALGEGCKLVVFWQGLITEESA